MFSDVGGTTMFHYKITYMRLLIDF